MRFSKLSAVALICTMVFSGWGPAFAKQDLAGIWFDDTGKGAVELFRCADQFCGRIYWLRSATDRNGRPLRDRLNPRAEQRHRSVCGLPVITGLKAQPNGSWDGGRIYDPKVGKSYDLAVERIGGSKLRITGYLGSKLLSRTFTWRRAPDRLAQCSE